MEAFEPEKLKKNFIKRENKKNFGMEEEIENSSSGLAHYFSAPNIRNKVKHPLFLAIKFSNVVKIYYNSNNQIERELVQHYLSSLNYFSKDYDYFIEDLQRSLINNYINNNMIKEKKILLFVKDIFNTSMVDNKKVF